MLVFLHYTVKCTVYSGGRAAGRCNGAASRGGLCLGLAATDGGGEDREGGGGGKIDTAAQARALHHPPPPPGESSGGPNQRRPMPIDGTISYLKTLRVRGQKKSRRDGEFHQLFFLLMKEK